MRRAIVAVAVLALAGCKRPNPPPREEVSPTPSPAAGAIQPAPSAKLNPADLDKYIAYEKALIASLPKRLEEYHQAIAAMKQSAGKPQQGVAAIAGADNLAKAIDDDKSRLQKQSGLSAEAIRGWDELTSEVATLHTAAASGPLAKMDAEAHARAAQLPPEQRQAAEKQLEGVDEQLKRQQKLTDQRAEFGDAAVDAVLAHESELAQLHAQRMSILAQMTAAGDVGVKP